MLKNPLRALFKKAVPAQRAASQQTFCVAAILAALAYLSTVNLDYAPLWDDEAGTALIAKTLLEHGAPVVDDGRFVVSLGPGFPAGSGDITDDMKIRYPQLVIYTTALGYLLFGKNETGARLMSVIATLGSMLLLWGIFRREYPYRPWFAVVALGLACFSQMVILYARSATYNALAMFLALLVFRLYLSFCEQARIRTAVALAVAAVVSFHAHFLISASFLFALGFFHIFFRRQTFDRRSWIIAILAGLPYVLQAVGYRFFDSDLFTSPNVASADLDLSWDEKLRLFLTVLLPGHFKSLNDNGIIYWTVALAFVIWRGRLLLADRKKTKIKQQADMPGKEKMTKRQTGIFAYKTSQYFVFILLATLGTALMTPQPLSAKLADVRYFVAFAPFGALVSAEILALLWARSKHAAVAVAALVLCVSLPGWPFAYHRYYKYSPHWTLPALVLEFHRDYPSALGESVDFLRKNAAQDDLVFARPHNMSARLAFHLGDKVLVGGTIAKRNKIPAELRHTDRKYIFIDNILQGVIHPDWIVQYGVNINSKGISLPNGGIYRLVKKLKHPFLITAYYRPEPFLHTPSLASKHSPSESVLVYRKIAP